MGEGVSRRHNEQFPQTSYVKHTRSADLQFGMCRAKAQRYKTDPYLSKCPPMGKEAPRTYRTGPRYDSFAYPMSRIPCPVFSLPGEFLRRQHIENVRRRAAQYIFRLVPEEGEVFQLHVIRLHQRGARDNATGNV